MREPDCRWWRKWKGLYAALPRNAGMKERRKKNRMRSGKGVCFKAMRDLSTVKYNRKVQVVRSVLRVQQQVGYSKVVSY